VECVCVCGWLGQHTTLGGSMRPTHAAVMSLPPTSSLRRRRLHAQHCRGAQCMQRGTCCCYLQVVDKSTRRALNSLTRWFSAVWCRLGIPALYAAQQAATNVAYYMHAPRSVSLLPSPRTDVYSSYKPGIYCYPAVSLYAIPPDLCPNNNG
jgi:hypothetical protein